MADLPSLEELQTQGLLDSPDETSALSMDDLRAQGLLDDGGPQASVPPIDPGSFVTPPGMEKYDPANPAAAERPGTMWDVSREGLIKGKEWVQQNVGRPISETALGILGFDPNNPLPGNITLEGMPEEALTKAAMSAYGAPKASERAKAALGNPTPQDTSLLEQAADMAGQAPLYALMPQGKATSVLGKAGTAAGLGAVAGGAAGALDRNSSLLQGALQGAVLGGGMSLLGSAAGAGLKALAPKPKQPVLVARPTINESVLRAQLEREAQLATERARGIEIDPTEYPQTPLVNGLEPVEGELSVEGARRFSRNVPRRVDQAAQDTANYLKGSGPLPQSGEAYSAARINAAQRGTKIDSPGAGVAAAPITPPVDWASSATPESVAAAANAATPPPPANSPPVQTPPVPVPAPGTLSAQQVQAFADIQANVNKIRFTKPTIWERMRDFLMSPGVRGERGVRSVANEAKVAKSLVKQSEDTLAAIDRSLGSDKNNLAFRKALSDLADGRISAHDIETAHPETWAKVREIVQPTLDEIAQNDQILRTMGYVPQSPAWMADPDVSRYAARAYLSKSAPKGAWGRVAPQDVVDDGIKYIIKQNPKLAATTEGKQQIANDVLDILNSGKSWEDIVGQADGPAWTKPFKNLKERQQLPKEIRALLGEIEDGPYRLAHTIGTQRALIATLSVAREVALNPAYSANGPLIGPTGKWVQMPSIPSMGPLAGKWVRPDVAEALGNAAHVAPRVSQITSKLMHFFKANVTVFGGVPAWSHEFIGNLDNAMLSGGFDITRPIATGKAFMRADKALRAYFKNPSSPEAAEMLEVFRLGAADIGWSRAEMRAANQNMLDIMDKQLKTAGGGQPSFWDIANVLPNIMKAGQKVYAKSGQAWDMIGLHMRTASYLNLRDKFILQGMAVPEARRLAAQRVMMSFPSPHNLSAGVENMRNSTMGFIAPFTTYIAEDARIRLQIPQRILEGETDLPIRMAVHYGILGGALAGAGTYLKQRYGVTDQEMDAANAEVTRQQAYYRPMQWALPIRDAQGRLAVTDFTWMNPAFRLPQGDIVDPLYKRLATNTLLYPFEGGMVEAPLRDLAQAAGGAQAPQQFKLRPGEAGLTVFLQQLNRSGLGGPSAVTRVQQLAKQAGQTEHTPMFQETLTPGQVTANVFGFPTKPVTVGAGSKTYAARGMEYGRNMKDLAGALADAVSKGNQERAARIRAMMDATIADFKSMQNKVEAAKLLKGNLDE